MDNRTQVSEPRGFCLVAPAWHLDLNILSAYPVLPCVQWVHGLVNLMLRVGLGSMSLEEFLPDYCLCPQKQEEILLLGENLACGSQFNPQIQHSGEHWDPERGGVYCHFDSKQARVLGTIVNRIPYIFSSRICILYVSLHICVHERHSSSSLHLFLKTDPASTSPLLRLATLICGF